MLDSIVSIASCDSGFTDECHVEIVIALTSHDDDCNQPFVTRINDRLYARGWRFLYGNKHECPACVRVKAARWALQFAGVVEAMQ